MVAQNCNFLLQILSGMVENQDLQTIDLQYLLVTMLAKAHQAQQPAPYRADFWQTL